MGKHTPFARMARFVDAAVGVEGVFSGWEYRVELGFLDVGTVSIDCLESCVTVDGETVGSEAEDRT